ncbi:DUF6730 family protein [Flagellimonas zhangzhouensis]|uniref:Uncharacterized protein n=1 Tax=Flagellimonas zhangzhouensis TaxID=1073328 RepID=A0A1H2V014_9FLAO|nr:DUF6730 family protein [Allomuricauda zhangzhouensis]SDQ12103.1 hypothetical protein SAMN05216294_0446 [Allomuricauda zhangzhouensis]SDW61668.1 hypothetical protein SAMN04487892_1845 [Allomuricauda zhangzhouensis]
MAKLDEIAELLTEEINGFEKSIGRLEKAHENLKGLPLRPDTSELNALLKEYGNNQKNNIEEQQRLMERILHKVERSVLLPSWALKLSWGLLICVLLVLGYSLYQVSRISKKEEAAYLKGRDDAIEHYGTFLDDSPEAKELYQKWLEDNGQK